MTEFIVCSNCGGNMARNEVINGKPIDWEREAAPICPVCRGVPGAAPLIRKRDVLGGFAWKRDPATGKKVPK